MSKRRQEKYIFTNIINHEGYSEQVANPNRNIQFHVNPTHFNCGFANIWLGDSWLDPFLHGTPQAARSVPTPRKESKKVL
jgi:hypothetical protein